MKKALVIVLVSLLVLGTLAGVSAYYLTRPGASAGPHTTLGRFASEADFIKAFKNGRSRYAGGAEDGLVMKSAVPAAPTGTGTAEAPAHSTTNVQVAGVDEADIVKNDGNYIYAVSGDSVFIVSAFPAKTARVVSKIGLEKSSNIREIFINGDKLVVMGSGAYGRPGPQPLPGKGEIVEPRVGTTFIKVYDVADRQKPALLRTVEYEGEYTTSRMIGANVHVVLTSTPYYALYEQKNVTPSDIIPLVSDTSGDAKSTNFKPAATYKDVQVVDPKKFTSFISVVSFSLADGQKNLNKRIIAGYSDNVFASLDNLYVASTEYQYYGMWPETGDRQREQTTVYKFKFNGPSTAYVASGVVPGTILNQFSMDEANGSFRIATTLGEVSREGSNATNNVYVLNPAMKVAGKLEGLAPGERIYSVRFMGNRAYLVTFKKVDPLFVIDLADPTAPKVLGELKIPGFSDYLHPYDETHVIGVGKNTVEASPEDGGNFAWYQGMKLAIFDVTDVANPKEMHKVEIGDRGTDSFALEDHKAFLFDRAKNLLVLPVLLAELTPEQKASPERKANDYGKFTYQGAYVYNVSLEGGFQLKGRVTHVDDISKVTTDYSYYGANDSVKRSLWIGDNLYTVSGAKVKVNRLADLADVATVRLQ